MISIKRSKIRLVKAIFGCFFGILGLILPLFASNAVVFADENDPDPVVIESVTEETDEGNNQQQSTETRTCNDSLGSIGWLVCPTTGKIAEAVDWLYDKNAELLELNPVSATESSPIYMIWNYFLGISNIAFILFLLAAIYSQITGVGISNYGIKKVLPKLIIAAILVNLSFQICSLAVDLSNVLGNGLRGVFSFIGEKTVSGVLVEGNPVSIQDTGRMMSQIYSSLAGGGAIVIGAGTIAFEGGEIWMLIPAVFGAFIAVAVGLITIALRHVVVILLIMVVPLAIVAYMLPNTESLFKKWKDLFIRMLVFYPLYSLLFGASSLAGLAIIESSTSGFGTILGVAVQIFPLFFSWSLMKMSGTFLGTVNAKITGLLAPSLATTRSYAESQKEYTKQKMLASSNVYSPTLKLRQFMSDRKIARDIDTAENAEHVKARGAARAARQNYKKDGTSSRKGERRYAMQARTMKYNEFVNRDKNNMNLGLGQLEVNKRSRDLAMRRRLEQLDIENMDNSDDLKAEQARGEVIDYQNEKGRQERMNDAMNAHMDDMNGYDFIRDSKGDITPKARGNYKFHFDKGSDEYNTALERYGRMNKIMEGNPQNTHYVMADATHAYDTHKKIYESKFQKYFDYTVPTKDLENRLDELSKSISAMENIDAIIAGMRILNQRGDTDLVKRQLDLVLNHGVQLGTHVSQALASFLMFEVKDNDPFLRRFGKYLNLETANAFNKNERKLMTVDYDEYIRGYHDEPDGTRMYAKKDMSKLMEGTSLDAVERTAFGNLDDSLKKAYGYDPNNKGKEWDVDGYLRRREAIQTAMEPAFLSASLKWLSGSEQINSAVKFWTGYELKQKKDEHGNTLTDEHDEPVYDMTPTWEDGSFSEENKKKMEKYYRRKTMDFYKDETTGQVLNTRTDFRDPSVEHLINQFLFENPEFKDEYNSRVDEIKNRRNADLNDEDNAKANKKDLQSYKQKIAGIQLRKILGETGKLEQILNMRRTSATANTKDWMRRMILLDDKDTLQKEVNEWSEKRKAKADAEKSFGDSGSGADGGSVYTEADRTGFTREIDKCFDDHIDDDTFYDESLRMLDSFFGTGPHYIKYLYKNYHDNYPDADYRDLRDELKRYLLNPDNYK